MKTDFNSGPAADRAQPLSDLAPGSRGVVVAVGLDGPVGRRLLDLGLLPGTEVEVVRRAPLGDPTVYALRGYRLCLRAVDARLVSVAARGGEAARADA